MMLTSSQLHVNNVKKNHKINILFKKAGHSFFLKMAAKRAFSCDLCDLEFDYQSKYLRHLNSAGHRRYSSVPLEQEEPVAMELDEPLLGDNQEDHFFYQVVSYCSHKMLQYIWQCKFSFFLVCVCVCVCQLTCARF